MIIYLTHCGHWACALKTFFVLLALPVALAAFAQSEAARCPLPPVKPTPQTMQALVKTAKDRGFLWKIEKDGRAGYLYGSIHLGKLEWLVPGPKTMAALRASDVIALELDILEPQALAQMSDISALGIHSVELPPHLKQRMDTIARALCVPVAALAGMHPMMQMATLQVFDARFSGLEMNYGTEVFLSDYARSERKPAESLETAAGQMHALLDGDTEEIIEAVENGMTFFEGGKQRTQTERLINAWAAGNLDELQRYESWCECTNSEADRKYMKGLLDDRNPHLAAGIDRMFRNGKAIFAAVGALHMTGANALPKLLKAMGYKVERVAFGP